MLVEEFFDSHSQASRAAARRIAAAIKSGLAEHPETAVIASGGSTPRQCYRGLAKAHLRWSDVHVVLSDERYVPTEDEASNEGMVRRTLLTNHAQDARMVPLYDPLTTPVAQCTRLQEQINSLPLPFSIALLGIGADGHFASIFPDIDNLEDALDLDGGRHCMTVHTAACPQPRLTLTLPTLLRSREIALLFFGEEKRATYESAKSQESSLVVSRLLNQQRTPVRVFWAP